MLKGEQILYNIADYYQFEVKQLKGKKYALFDIGIQIFPTFREALVSQYDKLIEDTLKKKHNWREEIGYIEERCHLFD